MGTASLEQWVIKEGKNLKSGGKSEVKRRDDLIKVSMMNKINDSKKNEEYHRKKKSKVRKKLSELCTSERKMKNVMSKLRKGNDSVRSNLRKKHDEKVKFLVKKCATKSEVFKLPEEVKRYAGCRVFQQECDMASKDIDGPVLVEREGERIVLSNKECCILAKGPKFCIFKDCKSEPFRCDVETTLVKHKWDVMSNESEEVATDESEEDILERERVASMAEEVAAESRSHFSEKENNFNMNRRRVTDYKANSRVILPRALPAEEESKLEVLRLELLEEQERWVKENCDCKGSQEGNLSKEEREGLKSLQKRVKEGEIVILPTDKSGKFAIMSMPTYILAGDEHTRNDLEVDLGDVRSNQRRLNGHVSMLIKVFKIGSDWQHMDRVRETMLNNSLVVEAWTTGKMRRFLTAHFVY